MTEPKLTIGLALFMFVKGLLKIVLLPFVVIFIIPIYIVDMDIAEQILALWFPKE